MRQNVRWAAPPPQTITIQHFSLLIRLKPNKTACPSVVPYNTRAYARAYREVKKH